MKSGSINFWIPLCAIEYNDNQTHVLCDHTTEEGSIFIVKDRDNKLKFIHTIEGKGKTEVDCDVSGLSSNRMQCIMAVWNVNSKDLMLYVENKCTYVDIEY